MLQPKRTKYRKAHKGRLRSQTKRGAAKLPVQTRFISRPGAGTGGEAA